MTLIPAGVSPVVSVEIQAVHVELAPEKRVSHEDLGHKDANVQQLTEEEAICVPARRTNQIK